MGVVFFLFFCFLMYYECYVFLVYMLICMLRGSVDVGVYVDVYAGVYCMMLL